MHHCNPLPVNLSQQPASILYTARSSFRPVSALPPGDQSAGVLPFEEKEPRDWRRGVSGSKSGCQRAFGKCKEYEGFGRQKTCLGRIEDSLRSRSGRSGHHEVQQSPERHRLWDQLCFRLTAMRKRTYPQYPAPFQLPSPLGSSLPALDARIVSLAPLKEAPFLLRTSKPTCTALEWTSERPDLADMDVP
jgi:hypothetical protein